MGSEIISRSNEYLQSVGKAPIEWQLPDIMTAQKQFNLAQEINQKIAESH